MTDMIAKFAANARGAEYGFFPAVLYALEQFEQKNNVPMYRLMALVNGKTYKNSTTDKSLTGVVNVSDGEGNGTPVKLTQFAQPLRNVCAIALSDVKFTFKDGKAGVKVGKQGGVNGDVLREMRELLEFWKNISVKSDVFKSKFPTVKSDVKPEKSRLQYKKRLDTYLDKLADEMGMSRDALIAFAQAKEADIAQQAVEPAH